ncbi:hypothetical protein Q8F55_000388 [Vanrija albida]|uniref:Bromo domain-containing protein n=1 Tax=Vanrija albida TaxID=181172 RepID=A0ABR3QD45_9TREE
MPRKSGSHPRAAAAKTTVPAAYPGKKDGGMEEAQWNACRDILDGVYKAKDGSRRMCDIFRELPDEDEYADYYETIPEPECLDQISTRLGQQGFASPELFFKQLQLVFLNAKHYNEENSMVYNDAQKLEDQAKEAWRARAAEGIFASADPTQKAARGRKPKGERTSATPTPATPAAAPPVIHLRVPRPEAAAPASAPTPAVPPTPAPTRETRGARASLSGQGKPAEPVKPAVPPSTSTLSDADTRIVAVVDAKLPLFEGPKTVLPGDPAPGGLLGSGWWGESAPEYERKALATTSYKQRIRAVAEAIAGYADPSRAVLSEVFNRVPAVTEIPFLPSSSPLSFSAILSAAQGGQYATLRDFDLDMVRLFEKARRWFKPGSNEYGAVLTLQRLYNALTAPYPLELKEAVPGPNATRFASLPYGPGSAPAAETGYAVTTSRIPKRDRQFTEEARHKGVSYRAGDYVHLINPDSGARPIVGQIFKTFVPTVGLATHHVTVCWYSRAEETVHPAEQGFFENEVFKTGNFCDHPVADIIEKVAVQPVDSAVRGRPIPPAFFPGWPRYVCRARYIDKANLFIAIKNWRVVIPEEIRASNPASVVPYERPITLTKVKSPYLMGVQGTGSLGRPKRQPTPADDEEEEAAAAYGLPTAASRRAAEAQQQARQHAVNPATPAQRGYAQAPHPSQAAGPSRAPQVQQRGAPAYPSPAAAAQAGANRAVAQPGQPGQQWQRPPPAAQAPARASLTFALAMGGPQVLEQVAMKEYLPPDTARLFEQDARNAVLWFSGTPLPQGAIEVPAAAPHSLEYLSFLAKRKRGVSSADARPNKRFNTEAGLLEPDADAEGSEAEADEDGDLTRFWWAKGQTPEQVLAGLREVAQGKAA